jgi:hypothetical protein
MQLRFFAEVDSTRSRVKELSGKPDKVLSWKDEYVPIWYAYKLFMYGYIIRLTQVSRSRRRGACVRVACLLTTHMPHPNHCVSSALQARMKLARERAVPDQPLYYEKLHNIWEEHRKIEVPRGDLDDEQYAIKRRAARRAFWNERRAALYNHDFLRGPWFATPRGTGGLKGRSVPRMLVSAGKYFSA